MGSPNSVAFLALFLLVPGSILAFATLKPLRAVLTIFFGSILFLPERVSFDAPLIPSLEKHTLAGLCMLIGTAVTARQRFREAKFGRGIDLVLLMMLLALIGTVFTNRDPQTFGETYLPGHVPGDVPAMAIELILFVITQFVLGRVLVRTADDAREVLRAFVVAGIAYVPFCLVEIKMSPQFHTWIYGFMQHDWAQVMRSGGWRPMVFMEHGLALALFMWGAGVAAWTLAKSGTPIFNLPATPFAIVISVTLVALKSMGALLYGLVAYPIILLFSNKAPLRVAGLLCFVFCLYPVVRTTDWFPREAIVDAAARYGNQERAQSLDFRFKNEEVLAERALERPAFGWGRYGRMYVFNEQGKKTSVADGGWIIMLGAGGITGLVLRFMLLQIPILSAMRRWKTVPPGDRLVFTGITLMSAFYSFDLLPNGYFNPIPMFLAGSVMGLSQGMATSTRRAVTPEQVMRWLQSLRRPPRELANARFVNRDQR